MSSPAYVRRSQSIRAPQLISPQRVWSRLTNPPSRLAPFENPHLVISRPNAHQFPVPLLHACPSSVPSSVSNRSWPVMTVLDPHYLPLPAPLRRRLLDRAGTTAQLAALALLLAIALGRRYASTRSPATRDAAASSSGPKGSPATPRQKGSLAAWLDRPVLPRTRTSRRAALAVAGFTGGLVAVNAHAGRGGEFGRFPFATSRT